MARKLPPESARAQFAQRLDQLLSVGTRPGGVLGEPWTYAAFAADIPSEQSSGSFASPRSVSNWCKGTSLPKEIDPILRSLFGPKFKDNPDSEPLRHDFIAARREKTNILVKRAPQNPAGGQWIVSEEQLTLDRTARLSDKRAAADPLRKQIQDAIRNHADSLSINAVRVENTKTWRRLRICADNLHSIVKNDPEDIPSHLGELYAILLELGQFFETDNRISRDPSWIEPPLDPDLQANLGNLIRLAAPWLRGFPTVADWDDKAGRTLVRPELFQPAREFNRIARQQGAIGTRDADEIEALTGIAENGGLQANKAGARAVGDIYNLILAGVDAATRTINDDTGSPLLIRRILETFEQGKEEIQKVAENLPPDVKHAILSFADDASKALSSGGSFSASKPRYSRIALRRYSLRHIGQVLGEYFEISDFEKSPKQISDLLVKLGDGITIDQVKKLQNLSAYMNESLDDLKAFVVSINKSRSMDNEIINGALFDLVRSRSIVKDQSQFMELIKHHLLVNSRVRKIIEK